MKYLDELVRSVEYLANDFRTIFIGQSVRFPGNSIFRTLNTVPEDRKIEMPVAEEFQMGFSTGLALNGFIPVTIYPRFDFLILALNQMVNHLDKIETISHGMLKPRVIIKVAVGSVRPLYPGVQHCQDYTEALKLMARNIDIVKLEEPEQIFPAYEKALTREDARSTVLIEYGDYYNEK